MPARSPKRSRAHRRISSVGSELNRSLSDLSSRVLSMGSRVVESVCGRGLWRFFPQHTCDPIAKTFALVSFSRVTREQRPEFHLYIRFLYNVPPNLVHPRPGGVATKPELITAWRFADESN